MAIILPVCRSARPEDPQVPCRRQISRSENGEYSPRALVTLRPWNSNSECLFSRGAGPRPSLRRPIFRGHHLHPHLLPADLSGAAGEARQHALLFQRRGRRRSGIPALPALPARTRARACAVDAVSRLVGAAIAGIEEHALSSAQSRGTGGLARRERSPSAAGHGVGARRVADRAGADAAPAARQAPAGDTR